MRFIGECDSRCFEGWALFGDIGVGDLRSKFRAFFCIGLALYFGAFFVLLLRRFLNHFYDSFVLEASVM